AGANWLCPAVGVDDRSHLPARDQPGATRGAHPARVGAAPGVVAVPAALGTSIHLSHRLADVDRVPEQPLERGPRRPYPWRRSAPLGATPSRRSGRQFYASRIDGLAGARLWSGRAPDGRLLRYSGGATARISLER